MKKNALYFFLIAVLFVSCEKETSVENAGSPSPTPVPTVGDSTYLTKMYDIDFNGTVLDTFFIETIEYDNFKRVISIVDTTNDPSVLTIQNKTDYFYTTTTDTLPAKTIRKSYNSSGINYQVDTGFYFYNSSGKRIKDSIIIPPSVLFSTTDKRLIVINYQYTASAITGNTIETLYPVGSASYVSKITQDNATLDANGNIVLNMKYVENVYPGSTTYYDTIKSVFTYDTKLSPWARLTAHHAFVIFPFGETFINEFAHKNNILKTDEISYGNTSHHYVDDLTGTYTYNGFNYPKFITITDPSNPMLYYKIKFIYKAF